MCIKAEHKINRLREIEKKNAHCTQYTVQYGMVLLHFKILQMITLHWIVLHLAQLNFIENRISSWDNWNNFEAFFLLNETIFWNRFNEIEIIIGRAYRENGSNDGWTGKILRLQIKPILKPNCPLWTCDSTEIKTQLRFSRNWPLRLLTL